MCVAYLTLFSFVYMFFRNTHLEGARYSTNESLRRDARVVLQVFLQFAKAEVKGLFQNESLTHKRQYFLASENMGDSLWGKFEAGHIFIKCVERAEPTVYTRGIW